MASITSLVKRDGVTIKTSPVSGTPTWTTVANINGNVSISDSRNTVTVRDFSSPYTDYDLQFVDGRTGTVTLNLNLAPGDTGFVDLKSAYENNSPRYLYVSAQDEAGTPNKMEYKFETLIQNFSVTLNQDNVAQVAVTFNVTGTAAFTSPA